MTDSIADELEGYKEKFREWPDFEVEHIYDEDGGDVTLYPSGADQEERVATWITAEDEDSYMSLDEIR